MESIYIINTILWSENRVNEILSDFPFNLWLDFFFVQNEFTVHSHYDVNCRMHFLKSVILDARMEAPLVWNIKSSKKSIAQIMCVYRAAKKRATVRLNYVLCLFSFGFVWKDVCWPYIGELIVVKVWHKYEK